MNKLFMKNPFAIKWKEKLRKINPETPEQISLKSFWSEKISIRHDSNVARIDGKHYIIGDGKGAVKGMSGAKYKIQFDSGRMVETDDLWHQGTIPEDFRRVLYDNAKFING